jgi:hypothetical protein
LGGLTYGERESIAPDCGAPGASGMSTNHPEPEMNTARIVNEDETELPAELLELADLIATLPAAQRAHLEPALHRVVDSTRRRRRILTLVQEALSQLRLDMKYLMFDLEATRRERDALRSERERGEEF